MRTKSFVTIDVAFNTASALALYCLWSQMLIMSNELIPPGAELLNLTVFACWPIDGERLVLSSFEGLELR